MGLRIYNTLTRTKEPFEPREPGHVRMYVCGVTVYDECHLGHARSAIAFDVIYRYLMFKGYKVTYVRNFTDIDDKILDRARREGVAWDEIARTYIEAFKRDMEALDVLRPTVEPLATDHIPEMIQMIKRLEDAGVAYCVDGNVYFSVSSFPGYGKLSRRDRDQMMAGARVEPDERKRDPLDFALWKRSQPNEPAWDSPWGPGRPGWHIECSCMSQKYLGETLDIHGGGLDLIFPHHENEIAQSEALTGKPFARYWIHNGPLTREGVKMSKSLGNILSIREALERYHPEELRLFFLLAHYRKPLDFTEAGIREARRHWKDCIPPGRGWIPRFPMSLEAKTPNPLKQETSRTHWKPFPRSSWKPWTMISTPQGQWHRCSSSRDSSTSGLIAQRSQGAIRRKGNRGGQEVLWPFEQDLGYPPEDPKRLPPGEGGAVPLSSRHDEGTDRGFSATPLRSEEEEGLPTGRQN
jgi:hypothetical protein